MRKIIAITGSRAEYGLSKSIFKAINSHKDLKLSLIVTGMHLLPEFGYTIKEIEKDGFKIVGKIKNITTSNTKTAMATSVGKCMVGIVKILEKEKPDILLVLTDLGHTLAGAIAGTYMNIPVAHFSGGDVSGHVDDIIRHAITKLSHIHFPITKKSEDRILKLGEEKFRIFRAGAPALDVILHTKLIDIKKLSKKFKLNLNKPILLMIQHPVSTELEEVESQAKTTLEALKELKEQTIIIYPNVDPGYKKIIKIIKAYKKYPFIQVYKSLPFIEYLSLMKIANVIIGNSTSGIVEAPSFGFPAINIGTRQEGRERAKNVIDVGYNKKEIIKAIKKALYDKKFIAKVKKCKTPYGDGKAGVRIAKVLADIKIDSKLLQKKLTY